LTKLSYLPLPKFAAQANLSQNNPVSGTKYTLIDTTKNCALLGVMAKVTWTVQPDPLEVHATVDGQTLKWEKANPVSTTPYCARSLDLQVDLNAMGLSTSTSSIGIMFFARSLKIELETTGGTVSNLSGKAKYLKW